MLFVGLYQSVLSWSCTKYIKRQKRIRSFILVNIHVVVDYEQSHKWSSRDASPIIARISHDHMCYVTCFAARSLLNAKSYKNSLLPIILMV